MICPQTGYNDEWDRDDEDEPSCACGANGRMPCEPTCLGPEDPEYLQALAMQHALDMTYVSLDLDTIDQEAVNYYAEELKLEDRTARRIA